MGLAEFLLFRVHARSVTKAFSGYPLHVSHRWDAPITRVLLDGAEQVRITKRVRLSLTIRSDTSGLAIAVRREAEQALNHGHAFLTITASVADTVLLTSDVTGLSCIALSVDDDLSITIRLHHGHASAPVNSIRPTVGASVPPLKMILVRQKPNLAEVIGVGILITRTAVLVNARIAIITVARDCRGPLRSGLAKTGRTRFPVTIIVAVPVVVRATIGTSLVNVAVTIVVGPITGLSHGVRLRIGTVASAGLDVETRELLHLIGVTRVNRASLAVVAVEGQATEAASLVTERRGRTTVAVITRVPVRGLTVCVNRGVQARPRRANIRRTGVTVIALTVRLALTLIITEHVGAAAGGQARINRTSVSVITRRTVENTLVVDTSENRADVSVVTIRLCVTGLIEKPCTETRDALIVGRKVRTIVAGVGVGRKLAPGGTVTAVVRTRVSVVTLLRSRSHAETSFTRGRSGTLVSAVTTLVVERLSLLNTPDTRETRVSRAGVVVLLANRRDGVVHAGATEAEIVRAINAIVAILLRGATGRLIRIRIRCAGVSTGVTHVRRCGGLSVSFLLTAEAEAGNCENENEKKTRVE